MNFGYLIASVRVNSGDVSLGFDWDFETTFNCLIFQQGMWIENNLHC